MIQVYIFIKKERKKQERKGLYSFGHPRKVYERVALEGANGTEALIFTFSSVWSP